MSKHDYQKEGLILPRETCKFFSESKNAEKNNDRIYYSLTSETSYFWALNRSQQGMNSQARACCQLMGTCGLKHKTKLNQKNE